MSTPLLKRQSVKPLWASYLEVRFMRKWMIRGMSWCQPWNRRTCEGADGCDEMTFCSSFPPTAVAAQPAAKDRRGDGDASRETGKTEQGGKGGHKMGNEWWKLARPCPSTAATAFPLSRLSLSLCPLFPSLVPLQRQRRDGRLIQDTQGWSWCF